MSDATGGLSVIELAAMAAKRALDGLNTSVEGISHALDGLRNIGGDAGDAVAISQTP
jgi:hypothetical protein